MKTPTQQEARVAQAKRDADRAEERAKDAAVAATRAFDATSDAFARAGNYRATASVLDAHAVAVSDIAMARQVSAARSETVAKMATATIKAHRAATTAAAAASAFAYASAGLAEALDVVAAAAAADHDAADFDYRATRARGDK